MRLSWSTDEQLDAESANVICCFAYARVCVTVQPYYNLATVVNNATLEYQVGGASNLAELRRLKVELDRDNLFSRHGLIGL